MPCRPRSAKWAVAIARSAATTCARPCSGPATASFRTPRWSWAWRARGQHPHALLITGMAGLLAGALSMARRRIRLGALAARVLRIPDGARARRAGRISGRAEAEELALIYNARGLDHGRSAPASVASCCRTPEQALDVLAREELGLNPDDLGSPVGAAASSFLLLRRGRRRSHCCPSSLRLQGNDAIYAVGRHHRAARCSRLGIALSLFTGRSALRGGLRHAADRRRRGPRRLGSRQAARREPRGTDARRRHRRALRAAARPR